MSTRNIPDDELDEFFKKSSENYPVEIAPGAWEQMEEKLDQAYRRTLLLRASLAVLVAAGLVLLLFLTVGNEAPMTGDQGRENAPGVAVSPSGLPTGIPPEGNKSIGHTNSVPSSQAPVPSLNHPSASPDPLPPQPAPKEKIGQPIGKNSIKGNTEESAGRRNIPAEPAAKIDTHVAGKAITTNQSNSLARPGAAKGPGAQPKETPSLIEDNDPGGEKMALPTASTPDQEREKLSPRAAEGTGGPALAGTDQENTVPAANAQPPAPADSAGMTTDNQDDQKDFGKAARQPFRFSLQVVVGPDLSSVGFPRPGQPGTNVGVLLEYHLTPRISLSGGVLHGTKVYQAGKYDYTPASKIWTYGVKPTRIDAVCEVIDIPLNVRFTAIRSGRSYLFGTMGLSTFLMRDERYAYTYDHPNPHLIGSWRVKNGSRHPFSVYNLSIGFERDISERFSLQAEPFVKVPLGGVGFGSVKLTSVGLFFSARYRFSPR